MKSVTPTMVDTKSTRFAEKQISKSKFKKFIKKMMSEEL